MNIPKPCVALNIDGEELEIFRCRADGGLVFQHQDLLRLHPGHNFTTPVILKDGEAEELANIYMELKKRDQS